jgi:RNA polymerase primary sigma factor
MKRFADLRRHTSKGVPHMKTTSKNQRNRRSPAARVARRPKSRTSSKRTSHDGRSKKSSAGKAAKDAAAATDHLSTYFRDLGEHGLLDPDEERVLARDLERAELETWQRLLSNPSTVEYLLGLLEARLENSLAEFKNVRKAAAAARKQRTKAARGKLEIAAGKAALQLRSLDHDRQHIAAMVGELERLQAGGAVPRLRGRLPFSPTSRTYANYLATTSEAYERGARLRDRFVRANLRLVVTMARRYDRGVMPLSDLIQEGNLGLMHAVSRFDHRRGLRFSTYACWWIRHAIGRALADKARAVRVPVHMIEAQQQLAKVKQRLVRELGRDPSRSEIAEAADMPLHKLNQMNRYLLGSPVSMDAPVGSREDEGRSLGEVLTKPDDEPWNPEEELTTQALSGRLHKLIDKLSPIEADVLRQRFGLQDDQERTFREIGDQYELSRERIRQIQNAALHKLRRALERSA